MNNKLETISNLFEGKEIRSIWNSEKEDYYFSVVDVISVLTGSKDPSHYWRTLKSRMLQEGNETVTNCDTLKLKAKDGKMRYTDMLDTKNIFRLIESIPSPKAEPFKLWLVNLGSERIDEVFNPELAFNRAVEYYRKKGYDDKWIKSRLTGIVDRFKLTDVWKESGIIKDYEYGILTKTDLGEIATRELAKEHKPYGLEENKKIARRGGNIAKITRDNLEKELGRTVISDKNVLNYEYIDEKLIEDK